MARKKTPNRSGKQADATTTGGTPDDSVTTGADTLTGASDGVSAEGGKVVSVTDAADPARPDPETVDAEIVSEPAAQDTLASEATDDAIRAETVETRPARDGEDVPPADGEGPPPGGGDGTAKKGGGFPWGVIAALVLIAVVGYALYALLGSDDDDVVATDDAPGLVVSDAEPFPGNELDTDDAVRADPIEGQAAPGTREAAIAADAARRDARGEADRPGTAQRDRMDEVAAADGEDADADDAVSALRARAAERRRAQRTAAGDAPFYVAGAGDADDASTQDDAQDAADDDDQDASSQRPAEGGADDMQARVAAARAAQDRIAREDAARRGDRADAAGQNTTADGDDDPNALTEFTQETEAPPTALAGRDRDPAARDDADADGDETADDAADRQVASRDAADREVDDDASERSEVEEPEGQTAVNSQESAEDETSRAADEIRRAVRRGTRPTGRVAPLGQDAPADEDEDITSRDDGAEEDDAQAIDPRGARVRVAATRDDARVTTSVLPDEATTEEELNERLTAVRAEVREDLLAETDARIRNAIEETEREVDSLREALTEQEQRSDQRIAQLTDRLEVLQRRDASASQQGVLILALSNLAGAIDRGEPFERQLDDVERLAPQSRSLASARRYASEGLPSDQVLEDRFQDTARRALAAEGRAEAEGGFGRLMANLRGLFTVRRIGEVEGDTPSAIISRAEAALERSDLAAATQELEALEGPAADAFEPWMEDARAKTRVTDRIDRLERAVLASDE